MGIFKGSRERLMRSNWVGRYGAKQLAQEIYAILSEQEVEFDGPVTIGPNPDEPGNTTPPLTLTMPTGSNATTVIQIERNGETSGTIGPSGGGGGSTVIPAIFPPSPTDVQLTPFVILGQVVSGTGTTYVVNVYPYGTSGTSYPVTAVDVGISPSETIPADAWVFVVGYPVSQTAAIYRLCVPIYYSDA